MPFRLLLYVVRVWEAVVREHDAIRLLPAVFPIVLHHSERGWVSATTLHGILDLDPAGLAAVGKHLPQFEMLLDDISAQSDDSLRARAISALGRLVLFCLRHAREPQVLIEQLRRWLDLIREIRAAPGGREALVLIWRYILATNPSEAPDTVVAQLLDVVGIESKEEVMTAGEVLIERGRTEGVRAERERNLLRLLRARFGVLPESVVARIHTADTAQHDAWLDRVLSATTLDDLLGGDAR